MEQTNKYQLNQWDQTDRIQMEDFNADNAKVEAALSELSEASRYVYLKSLVTAESLARVDLDLSDIDWSAYPQLLLLVNGTGTNTDTGYILMNDATSYYYYRNTSGNTTSGTNAGTFYLSNKVPCPFERIVITGASACPQCDIFRGGMATSSSYYYTGASTKGEALTKLTFVNSHMTDKFHAGFSIKIYGIRF